MSKFSSIIIVVLVIALIGAVLIWRYGLKEGEKIITPPGDLEITFAESCNELGKQLYSLTEQANYCDDDSECLVVEYDICSPGSFMLVNRGADLTKLYEGMAKFETSCPVCDWAPLIQEQKGGIKCSNHICVMEVSTLGVNCVKMAESFAPAFPDFFESVEKTVEWCDECVGNNGVPYLSPFVGPFCNAKTSDAGKICTDFSQCEGVCLGKDKNSISGLCSDVETVLGCVFQMENGKAIEICYD